MGPDELELPISWVQKTSFFSARPAVLRADPTRLAIERRGEIVFQTATGDVTFGREEEFTFIAASDDVVKVMFTRLTLVHKLGLAVWIVLILGFGGINSDGTAPIAVLMGFALLGGAVAFRPWLIRREGNHANLSKLLTWSESVRPAEPLLGASQVEEIRPRGRSSGGTAIALAVALFPAAITSVALRAGLGELAQARDVDPNAYSPADVGVWFFAGIVLAGVVPFTFFVIYYRRVGHLLAAEQMKAKMGLPNRIREAVIYYSAPYVATIMLLIVLFFILDL